MKAFIFFSIAILLAVQSEASVMNCVVSRGGNEFWVQHLPNREDTCETTANISFKDKDNKARVIQFTFSTSRAGMSSRDSHSHILMKVDDSEPMQISMRGDIMLTQMLPTGELLILGCTLNNAESIPAKTSCVGATSYPNAKNLDKLIDNIDKWVEEIPEGIRK